jgi:hypothetical protein
MDDTHLSKKNLKVVQMNVLVTFINCLRLLAQNLTIIRLISFNILFCFLSQVQAGDGKAIEKDKLELEENVNVTIRALQAEIKQLKLHLETSSAELSAVRTSFKL